MKYSIHGITIETPFPCPELPPVSGDADVTVRWGKMESSPFPWHEEGVCYKAAPGKYLLSVRGVADYLVMNGKDVTIEPARQSDQDALRLFFYNEVIGALLMQRGCLLLKGFVAEGDGRAFAFTGPTPSGKTMLAAKLAGLGFRIVADGFFCVSADEIPQAQPGYPWLRTWERSLKTLGVSPTGLKPVRSGMQRFYLPLGQSFLDEAVRLETIFVLAHDSRAGLSVEETRGAEKLFALLPLRYHPELAEPLGMIGVQNRIAANLANSAKVKIARYNDIQTPLEEFVARMERELGGAGR